MRTHTTRYRQRSAAPRPFFQAKLTVNTTGDAYEQEADRIADQVVQRPAAAPGAIRPVSSPSFFSPSAGGVQRKCAACEHEEKEKQGLQRKEGAGTSSSPTAIGSMGDASGKAAPSVVSDVLSSGGGQPMESGTRQFMESRFGQDFSQVRIHTDSRAAESASAIQARAYTSGRDVVFGAGEYQPGSEGGRRLLAHELVHVGQQGGVQRKVQRTMEEGHDLTSPRFVGDPTLEACYDDKARLNKNSRGESVRKVQQALIDLGYDLGPTGADGDYGDFTWNAVKKFKKDQSLGWEHMGDVGPGTMARLDAFFPFICPLSIEDNYETSEAIKSKPDKCMPVKKSCSPEGWVLGYIENIIRIAKAEKSEDIRANVCTSANERVGHKYLLSYFGEAYPKYKREGVIKSCATRVGKGEKELPNWCGIFALYVLKKAELDLGNWGESGYGISFVRGMFLIPPQGVRAGDIGFDNSSDFQHHFIVIRREGNTITKINGNSEASSTITENTGNVNNNYSFYRALQLNICKKGPISV